MRPIRGPVQHADFPVLMAAEKIADMMLAGADPAVAVGGRAMA